MKELLLAAVAFSTLTTESGAVWFKIVHDLEPSQGALDAIAKPPNGSCPWGWTSSGSFCLRSGDSRH